MLFGTCHWRGRVAAFSFKALPLLVFVVGLLATAELWSLARSDAERVLREEFEFRAGEVVLRVDKRMRSYEQVLEDIASVFTIAPEMDRTAFRDYVARLDLARNFPGTQGIGWMRYLQTDEVQPFVADMRVNGFPGYAVRPDGRREVYGVVKYLEPYVGLNLKVPGYDLYSEPIRHLSLQQARDEGITTISGRMVLIQDLGAPPQAGVLMSSPVYRRGAPLTTAEERRAAMIGWTAAPLRMTDLLNGILGRQSSELGKAVGVYIHDGNNDSVDSLLFDNTSGAMSEAMAPLFRSETTIKVGGRQWRMEFFSRPDFDARLDSSRLPWIGLAGTAGSFLLALVLWLMISGRDRAVAYATSMTRELRESQARLLVLAEAIEQSPVGIVVTNGEGLIEYVNAGFANNTGYSPQEVVGQNPRILQGGKKTPGEYSEMWETIKGGRVWHGEFHNRRKDGTLYWERAVIAPVHDLQGVITHFVGVKEDISERKAKDDELRKLVGQLTEANTELERFAYVASHDLREPLRTITSFTQLLHQRYADKLDGEAVEFIGLVVGAAKRMHALIGDLLAYSRIPGKGSHFVDIDAGHACELAIQNLHESIEESGAQVRVDPLPMVTVDEVQLMQLFQNLIGNAIKFRRRGATPEVHVSARRQGAEWIFSVTDNGIGVAQSHQDVFEIFRRLHTQSEYPGTGVGLAICKRIVQRHGGRIWYEDNPGGGTAFHFSFNAADS
jgi:PAS domain S-box-containing protein